MDSTNNFGGKFRGSNGRLESLLKAKDSPISPPKPFAVSLTTSSSPPKDKAKAEAPVWITKSATMAEREAPLKAVQVEGLVVMKMIKHCSTRFPTTATGALVGMDVSGTLQVTNTFPFPVVEIPQESHYDGQHVNSAAVAPRAKANAVYQAEMLKMLREVNIDAQSVGWYTSANMGNFCSLSFIENQYHYQKDLNERTVALVNDVSRSSQGGLSLRAFRLSPQFMAAYKENKFTTDNLQKSNLRYQDFLVELPIQIHNSHLISTFLHQLPAPPVQTLKMPSSVADIEKPFVTTSPFAPNYDSLTLNIDPFLSQTCDQLLDSIETHHTESNNFSYYSRALAREQAKISQWQAKRKAENALRASTKQAPLPEDEWQRLFRLPTEPNRLESMLNSRQVEQYSRQVDGFVAATTGKMFAVRGNLLPGEERD